MRVGRWGVGASSGAGVVAVSIIGRCYRGGEAGAVPGRSPAAACSTIGRMPDVAPGPLAGLRVIDCSTVLAGPYCTMLLGDLGRRRGQGRAARGRRDPRLGTAVGRQRGATGRGPPPTTSRSTATSAASGSTSAIPRARRSCATCWPMPTSSSRTSGRAASPGSASTTRRSRRLNPRLVHLAITGYGTDGPAADRPGYDFVIQATSGLMTITGAPDADGGEPDEGGGRDQRRRDRDARRGERAGGAPGAGRDQRRGRLGPRGRRRPGGRPAHRHLAPRRHPRQPRQPGPERVRHRRRARAGSGTRTRTSSRTRRSRRPMARSRSRSAPSGSGGSSCIALELPEVATDQRFATNGDRVEHRAELRPILAARFLERDRATWLAALEAAEHPVRADPGHRRGVRLARGGRPRDDRRAGAPGLGRHPPGGDPVPARRARPRRSGRRRRCSARTPTRSSRRSAGRRTRSPPSAALGVV